MVLWLLLLAPWGWSGASAQAVPPACPVPVIVRPDFSATQIAYLVSELQRTISAGCYSVVANSLAVCLPDLSLESGCCTPDCARSMGLAVTPECLAQFWTYICSNSTFYAPVVGAVVERCLPESGTGLQLSCPVNQTLLNSLLNVGNLLDMANATNATSASGDMAAEEQRDSTYYAACAQQVPRLWPDFNNQSLLFDSLLAFATDVPQDCLRTALSYLPLCYDDLTYQSGCCSLRCRAAVEKVPLTCFASYLQSLCNRVPSFTKYFFNAAQRCSNINLTCQGITGASHFVAGSGDAGLPLVASSTGQCPLSQTAWPAFNALRVTSQTLKLLSDASSACKPRIARVTSSCLQELGTQTGCCSYDCAIAMRSVPDPCHSEFQKLLCRSHEDAKYFRAMADRCLGAGHYDCPQGP